MSTVTLRTVVPKNLPPALSRTYKHPGLEVKALLGADPPTPTGGYGGWDIVGRPRRVGLTQWNGRQPIQMDVSILFDGFKNDESVEYECVRLERMALPFINEPPVVRLFGSSIPHNDLDWVINNIAWGSSIKLKNGDRIRQEATISLISYQSADKVRLSAAKKARAKKGRK